MRTKNSLLLLGLATAMGLHSNASANWISVTVENLTPSGGPYFTPVWFGFHDGSFDSFDVGAPASGSLEALAEGGDPGGLRGDFSGVVGGRDGVVFAPDGFAGAPVFDPGDSAGLRLDLDPMSNRYFSFASMIIPSNDAFIGNDDPMAYEIFDATGVFTGPLDILILGEQIWDAGTEVNDGLGAPFLANVIGDSSVETDVIRAHPGFPYGPISGGETVAGTFIEGADGDFSVAGYRVARISINQIPEPQIIAMFGLGLGLMTVVGRRREKAKPGV